MEKIVRQVSENKESKVECFIDGMLFKYDNPIEKAIESSSNAFKNWINNSQRSSILKKVSELLKAKHNLFLEVANITNRRYGITIEKDLVYCSESFNYYAKWSNKLDSFDRRVSGRGVIGSAILEDCPIFIALSWLTSAPLAAGNTVILLVNPSYSVIATCFAVILHEAGIPPGVVNVIPFMNEKSFSSIAHCFSNIIGIIPETFSISDNFHFSSVLVKKRSLCPILVLKSADIDSAVDCVLNSTQSNEAIWFPNVVYVEEPIYESFLNTLKCTVTKFNNVDSRSEIDSCGNDIDPVLDEFVTERKSQGYKLFQANNKFSKCVYLINFDESIRTPTIIERNETYHLISILPVRTAREGVSLINNYGGGLCVSLWSNDAVETNSIPFEFHYATVWVNSYNLFDPSVPFSARSSFGYGTFSGKRALYDNLILQLPEAQITDCYPPGRNLIIPKKEVTSIIGQSITSRIGWSKLSAENRSTSLENIAKFMEMNWKNVFESICSPVTEQRWMKAVDYVYFWSVYVVDSAFERIAFARGSLVQYHCEPLGTIGIFAGRAPIDVMVFLISAGLVYGNTIVVGIATDESSSVVATALETLFSRTKPGLVSVVTDTRKGLWEQFVSNGHISAIWATRESDCNEIKYNCLKNVIGIEPNDHMKSMAEFFEMYATKHKSIWMPTLFR